MTAEIISSPLRFAKEVCHEEQLRIWAEELIGTLSVHEFLRDDLSYDDGIALEKTVMHEIRSIIESAFNHPEAKAVKRHSR